MKAAVVQQTKQPFARTHAHLRPHKSKPKGKAWRLSTEWITVFDTPPAYGEVVNLVYSVDFV